MSCRNRSIHVVLYGFACAAITLSDCAAASRIDDPAPATRSGVLVFRNGRVIEGEIAETETHYVVVRPVGKIEVLKSEIDRVAKDLDEVYRQLAARINDRDPADHLKLAQWCIRVNLRERAIVELERAGNLSGNPAKVKGMLDALRRTPAAGEKPASSEAARSAPAVAEIVQPHADLPMPNNPPFEKDLPATQISSFTLRIQPMLTRGCATAGCHDAGHSGPLALQRSQSVNQRTTQNNLRATLSVIDADEPDSSPLLSFAARPHPRNGREPASNPLSDPAFATLVEWVRGFGRKPAGAGTDEQRLLQPANQLATPAAAPAPGDSIVAPNTVPTETTPGRAKAGAAQSQSFTSKPSAISPGARPQESQASAPKKPVGPQSGNTIPDSRIQNAATPGPDQLPARDAGASSANANQRAAPEKFQPVDPFDPEIFNRQFAPRETGPRP